MRRTTITLLAALTVASASALSVVPAQAQPYAQSQSQSHGGGHGHGLGPGSGMGLENCTASACHFGVPPGTYDVRVRLGGEAEASTGISGETRRTLLAAHDVPLIDLTAKTKALVESLGVEGSKALYLYNEKRDNTHTSAQGAAAYAELVRDELLAQSLVSERLVR
ncbi:hypothetical protein AB0D14_25320 [Streptomyces sp. NPDC048484]|uniref:hypothetical protein n=1 Tax=Streptomyces sp. NPDC048484 TaxID=3155146 RepID=UPI003414F915